ncbi:MAG TPA: hypothetical protein PK073_02815 [Ignavibacteriaceae bacterium]|jgi:hypothetical protein|nr:MAG: hypothetical protein BWY38_01931 [Ignavibacteria bacterium ADurb.Bin266]OQY74180.1 MAG: hypothetical protein B6D44_05055 [Ignavibacteriales bacterium UTCHB2]HQF41818.1 hypothetical protein [Ignavibacteriaceae bacterium]HQI39854.1 hypothetical protein [Ignavibacteriaceae bacterium]HQJ46567.1 hypothetical protein [Ignavibacteriaceae bacterium]
MNKVGQIEIIIKGFQGNIEITPENYDINNIIDILKNAEDLLFPNNKKERPIISYNIEKGSVKHIIKTSLQAILGFNAVLFQVQNDNSIDFLEAKTAKAFEFFQEEAQKQNYEFYISTSVPNSSLVVINKDTKFQRTEEVWAEAEFYFYGVIIDAGGKTKANIHLDTKEYGLLTIDAPKEVLAEYESNPLYKSFGVRASGKQNINTGEIDKNDLRLIDIIDYNPAFKEDYLKSLIKKAKQSWENVNDADEWLSSLRGYE